VPLSIQKSTANYVAADSEIDNQKLRRCRFRDGRPKILPLLIHKSTAKKYTVADSEIDSQKLRCCLFRNRQRELRHYRPINRKPNCAAANSEISSQLGRCRFRDRQPKTASLPIQKSAMRTAPVPTHKLPAKLCRCRFRDRQPKTLPLPIQRTAATNCVAANSEIGNDGGVISVYFFFFGGCFQKPKVEGKKNC